MDIASLRRLKPELNNLSDEEVVRYVAADYPNVPVDRIASELGVAVAAAPPAPRTFGGTMTDVGISALKGAVAVPEAAVGLADMATGGRVGKALEQGVTIGGVNLGYRPEEAQQVLQDKYSDPQKAAFAAVQDANGIVDTTVAAVTHPSTIAHSVIESLPSMAAGGLLGRGVTAVGARAMSAEAAAAGSMGPYAVPGVLARAARSAETAAGIGGALGEGVTMAGQDAEQIRASNADRLLNPEQAKLAVGIGAGGALFAMLGAKVAKSMGIHDVDTMVAAGRVSETAQKGLVRKMLEGAFSEGILEELPQSVMEQVLQNIAMDQPIDKDVDKQAVMGALAGAVMGAGANWMGHKAPQKKTDTAAPVAPPLDPTAGPLSAAASVGIAQGATAPAEDAATLREAVDKLSEHAAKTEPDPLEMRDAEIARQKQILKNQQDAQAYEDVTGGAAHIEDPFADVPVTKPGGASLAANSTQLASGVNVINDKPIVTPGTVDEGAHESHSSPLNDKAATPAQILGDSAELGHVKFAGLPVSIENADGSTRTDLHNNPPKWETTLSGVHYGRILRTEGADGDHVDVYLRAGTPIDYDGPVYVIDQVHQDGKGTFDEHKVMAGFMNRAAAINAYRQHYSKGWQLGRVTEMQMDQFKDWLKTGDLKAPASPKGPLTPAEVKTTKGAQVNASASKATTPQEAGGKPAGSDATNNAGGKPGPGEMADANATAGGQGQAPGPEAAASDAQPAGERVGPKFGEVLSGPHEFDFGTGKITATIKSHFTPAAFEKIYKEPGGMIGIELHGPGVDSSTGSKSVSGVTYHGALTPEDFAQYAADAAEKHAKKPAPEKKTLQQRRAEGRAKKAGAVAPAEAAPAVTVDKANIIPYRKEDGSIGYRAEPIVESPTAPTAPTEKFHASISAAEDALKAAGRDTHRIERDRRGLVVRPKPAEEAKKYQSKNAIFTDEAAEKARALLKSKIGTINSGLDPETLQAALTLAGWHVENGARKFADFVKAMVDDLGDGARPYLKSWYMALKYDPRSSGMQFDDANTVDQHDVSAPAAAKTEDAAVTKWFGSREKAQAFIDKRGIGDTHKIVEATPYRFEIHSQTAGVAIHPEPNPELLDELYGRVAAGNMPKDNIALKKIVQKVDGTDPTPERMKQAQEALEAAIVRQARVIAAAGDSTRATFDNMLALYESQPNLNIRTSTSVANQAYSTPAPLAYLASRMADIGKATKVLEPTAGTGMLLMEANPKNAQANELDPDRAELLRAQGFNPTMKDAATARLRHAGYPVDAVIANPPFGGLHDEAGKVRKERVDGYRFGQIDHLIAARALEAMRDDGRAVLILGANKVPGGMSEDDRVFLNWLYANYGVHTHFEVDGSMYTRQGAGWPVRVIAIEGREKSSAVAPRAGTIERVDTWDKVYERYEQSLDASRPTDGVRAPSAVGSGDAQAGPGDVSRPAGVKAASDGGRGSRGGAPRAGNEPGSSPGTVGDRGGSEPGRVGDATGDERLDGKPAAQSGPGQAGERGKNGAADAAGAPRDGGLTSEDNQFQVKYVPRSSRKDEGVLIPINMAQPLQDALSALEDAVGDLDEFVKTEMGYESVDEMHDSLMGLQVDSIAAAIHQVRSGKGIVIADQTGIGKGRQAAAMIRWAVRSGYTPVFVTVKPELFSDMHGDLADIGTHDVTPFILNVDEPITTRDGEKILSTTLGQRRRAIEAMKGGQLPDGHNALFMTYSQINSEAYGEKRAAVQSLAHNAVFILDESHNASGDSNTGTYIKGLLDLARGTVYLSATYAKRPDNMPLYFKTDMGQAVADDDTLMNAMESGGLPLQTVVSNNLVKAGQMFRRERSFDGVNIATVVDTDNGKKHAELSDKTTSALRAIMAADKAFHTTFVQEMQDDLEDSGGVVQDTAGNQAKASVDHTQFSSVVHNFVRQMLLGLKADQAADIAIAALKDGKKALIALENTMGSFLGEYAASHGIQIDQPLGQFDYRTVLSRALERTRYVIIKDAQGNKEKRYIPLDLLDDETRRAYDAAQEIIDYLELSTPVSPIDWMRKRLTDAGYKVAEITGRDLAVDYSDPAKPKLSQVDHLEQNDKVRTTRLFNSGKLDAIILNVSGSTGISLHASERFEDQRKRKMIVAQPAQDINILMQMLGRIHRTGQVELPEYDMLATDLPAERRPAALTAKKMKSLNANTSSNTESATSVEAVDMMNKYGDRVVAAYLDDNPKLKTALGFQPSNMIDPEGKMADDLKDVARKATGRLALMPVEVQRQFYEDVEGQYTSLLEYLTRTNQNDLEPRTLDFDAKELKSQTIFDGPNPASPFGSDAVYGEYSVKAQGKPMTHDEIRAEMKEHLGGKNADAHTKAIIDGLTPAFTAFYDTMEEGEQRETAKAVASRAQAFIRDHAIGSVFRVDINGDTYNAIVTNVKSTHKARGNPFSMSKVQVTVALNGSLRHATVPATQFAGIEVSRLPIYGNEWASYFQARADDRETAKIITGNLLAAYGELRGIRGNIISFTRQDGSTDQGILMPKLFTVADGLQGGYRFRTGADAVKFLHESYAKDIGQLGIASRDNAVRIVPGNGGAIEVRVPKSKAKGAKFFLDKKILAITGDFTSRGDRMVATVPGSRAATAVDALSKKTAIYALPSHAEKAKQMFGPKIAFDKKGKPSLDEGDMRARQPEAVSTLPANAKRIGELQQKAEEITGHWKRKLEVTVTASVASPAVPREVRAMARERIAAGGSSPVAVVYQNHVWVFADRTPNDSELAKSIAHEIKGHFGLRGNFGDELDAILRQITQARPAKVAEMMRRTKITNRLEAAEEVLVEMAEKEPQLGFVKRAIAAVRNFLRTLGVKLTLSDNDMIANWILPAARFVEKGERTATIGKPASNAAFSTGSEPFYSALSKGLEAVSDKSLSAIGWEGAINALTNKGKAKADEVEWSGVKDWLHAQEGRIQREAVLEYLANNGVRVSEVVKGDPASTGMQSRRDDLNVELTALGFDLETDPHGGPAWITRRRDGQQFSWDDGERAFVDEDSGEAAPARVNEVAIMLGEVINEQQGMDGGQENDPEATRYEEYTLPGGTNYREVLLTLPTREGDAEAWWNDEGGANEEVPFRDLPAQEQRDAIARYRDEVDRHQEEPVNYHSSHWNEDNVLAHIRTTDRYESAVSFGDIERRIVEAVGAKSARSLGNGAPAEAVRKGRITAEEAAWYSHERGFKNVETAPHPPGKRVLFVEEIQSDWAQAGRKRGFAENKPFEAATSLPDGWEVRHEGRWQKLYDASGAFKSQHDMGRAMEPIDNVALYNKQLKSEYDAAARNAVPVAPFVGKTDAWLTLALKRIVKMAVDEGYDKVAFVNGQQSADRYGLENHIEALSYLERDWGGLKTFELQAYPKRGDHWKNIGNFKADELADVVGAELARKIIADEGKEIPHRPEKAFHGLDLKVGGQGMKAFYDQIIPATANKLLAKIGGGKVSTVQLHGGAAPEPQRTRGGQFASGRVQRAPTEQPGFDVTDKMRETAGPGLPLFHQPPTRTIQVDGTRRPVENAAGQPLVANHDAAKLQAFWRYFGDSKVVDEQGRPMAMAHGTFRGDIKSFKRVKGMSAHFGSTEAANERLDHRMEDGGWATQSGRGATVIPAYLAIKNPVRMTDVHFDEYGTMAEDLVERGIVTKEELPVPWDDRFKNFSKGLKELIGVLEKKGYDGIVYENHIEDAGADSWIPFHPGQIKSAIGNRGTFNPKNPDIRFSQPAAANPVEDYAGTNNIKQFLSIGRSAVDEFRNTPGKLNWWSKTFGTPYDLAERNAPFKRVYDRVQSFLEDVSHYATEAADMAPHILPKIDTWRDLLPEALGGKAPLAVADKKAIQTPVWEGTLMYTRDQDGKPIAVGDLETRYENLDVHERGKMLMSRGIISEADLKRWQNLPIASFEGAVNNRFEREYLTAGIRWTDKELKDRYGLDDRTLPLYHEARDALDRSVTRLALSDMLKLGGKEVRPIADAVMESATVEEGSETLRKYLFSLADSDPDRSSVLTDTAARINDKATTAKRLLDKGYAPLMRFGKYTVDVVDRETGKREFFGLYEGRMEARAAAEELARQFPAADVRRGTVSEEAYKQFAGVSVETLELFGEMLGLEAEGAGPMHEAFQEYLKLTKSNRSAMRRMIERKGIAGFNQDIGRVLAGFVYSNARQTSSNLHMGQIGEAVENVGRDADGNLRDGELKDAAYRLMRYVQDPQQEAPGIRQLLFAQYLGGSIASALVNMTQPIQVTMPYLSQFGGIRKAAGMMRGALATAWAKTTGNEELDHALKRAEEDGIVAPQEVHQLMAYARGAGALKSGDGTTLGNATATASNAAQRVMQGWGKLFSTAELFNRRVTYVAAWNLARANGKTSMQADAFARKAVNDTQFVYNKGNRPEWARGAIGATLFTFKQYSISYMELMHRMYTQGGPEGKKAALFSLAMLMFMGGAGGLPFAEDASDIVEGVAQRMGYNLSIKQKRRELLNAVFGDVLGGFLEKGVSGIPGAPLDVSGRMGMGNLIPGTGLFQKKTDHTSDVLELAGPAGDFAKRVFQGVDKAASGKPVEGALNASPQAIRNLSQAADMFTTGMYKDQGGKKIIDTDAWDAFIKATGFQPNDVARAQETDRIVQSRVAAARLRETEIADEWAKRQFDKDPAAAQWARDQVKDWNEKNPDSPIRISYQQITSRLRKMNETRAQRIAESAPKAMRAEVRRELAGGGR